MYVLGRNDVRPLGGKGFGARGMLDSEAAVADQSGNALDRLIFHSVTRVGCQQQLRRHGTQRCQRSSKAKLSKGARNS